MYRYTKYIIVSDKEDIEYKLDKKISDEYYKKLIEKMEDEISYNDYKDTFLKHIKFIYENNREVK
tara:strand:- start:808 stop:1002 length:195 start_codon:yes stop_codon:yes gene_type:complete